MIRSMKLSKWKVIVLLALPLSYFAFDQLVLSPIRQARLNGSTIVTWTAPIENEDDKPLKSLAGFLIHCWTQNGQYSNSIYVEDPAATRYEVKNLPPGNYKCAVTAIDTEGEESALSNIVAKTVP